MIYQNTEVFTLLERMVEKFLIYYIIAIVFNNNVMQKQCTHQSSGNLR